MHVGGGHLCSEFRILWASTENFSGRLPADLRSCPTFHTKECLVAKATTSSTPARLHIFPWLGFNPSSISVNLSVVPAFLAAQRKKHTGFELFLLELLWAKKYRLLTGPAQALLCVALPGSVLINGNFGKHSLNNSSQKKSFWIKWYYWGFQHKHTCVPEKLVQLEGCSETIRIVPSWAPHFVNCNVLSTHQGHTDMLRCVSQVLQQHVAGTICPGLLNVLKCYCDQLSEAVCSVFKKKKKKTDEGRKEGMKEGTEERENGTKMLATLCRVKVNSSGDNSI